MSLASFAVASATALYFGTRGYAWQLGLVLSVGVAAYLTLRSWFATDQSDILELDPNEEQRVVKLRRGELAKKLLAHGATLDESSPARSRPALRPFLPGAIAMTWWLVVQLVAGTSIRVLHAGQKDLVLVVDSRKMVTVAPTQFEDPRAGKFVRVLGGMRRLELFERDGRLLDTINTPLWPGRQYVVGTLPQGRCLFLEKTFFEAGKSRSELYLVEGDAPFWEIPERVDIWFEAQSTQGTERAVLTSGGVRHAVRLLPCEGGVFAPGRGKI
jgi:hypothetical protein